MEALRVDQTANNNDVTKIKTNTVQTDDLKNETERKTGSHDGSVIAEEPQFEINHNFTASFAMRRANVSSDTNKYSTEETEKNRSWCIIGNDSMWPGVKSWGWRHSVAHVAEALLPCWSWFVRRNTTKNCGFYIIDNLQQPHAWGKQLMENIQCEIKYSYVPQEWNMTTTSILETRCKCLRRMERD